MAATQNNRQYELILLGATGYTGKLVAEWISIYLPEDLKWAIAGRNAKKLQGVIDELKKVNANRKLPDVETCELKPDQLDTLVKKTKLLITTVGPFMHYGEPVLAACAANGTHYLDSTGEVPWIYDMIAKYDTVAKANKSIIIPEAGLDSVPADIMAYVLSRTIRKRFQADCERVIMTLYDFKSGVSGGTSLTMLELFSNYSLGHLAKSMHPYSLSPKKFDKQLDKPADSPSGGLLGLPNIAELGGLQTKYIMSDVDTCIVHRSAGLYGYGSRFRFDEYMRAKSLVQGLIVKVAFALVGLFLALPPTRMILAPLFKKYLITPPGEGPSRESMKNDFMSYRAVGVAEGSGQKVTGKLDCGHGGYAATAITLAAAAHVILRGKLDETEASRLGGGILTPATLGEQFVDTLNEFGMKINVDE
ncbi:Saccharopine dehydrogenase-domain-containing protein [Boeremia exigua]|uniref:Saccharopine dehydrogenase-domain-containing protein n=1 Tax=Boeremia exigua TaxID=749465 RepID=UPI001E8D85A5|nr:Saccharopine dehydrogenase-domain-containing protein [Boeremia exigua]KAH6625655.1 Saccharopine dehydrogenase-domain-containing protein [Boeremia exigua]